jgi:hypothetical protein
LGKQLTAICKPVFCNELPKGGKIKQNYVSALD